MVYGVVMAGGSGTRFWPASRSHLPKQFLTISGDKTLLQSTIERLAGLAAPERTLIVGGQAHESRLLEGAGTAGVRVVLEPTARNTAACIGLAACHVVAESGDGLMVVVPADHFIGNPLRFHEALTRACEAARSGGIATIGISPSRPETGYGYIEQGESVGDDVFQVVRFVEKPSYERALEYLGSGRFLWNCGIFVASAMTILGELERCLPETQGLWTDITRAIGTPGYAETLESLYELIPSISFDVAVMEKTQTPIYVIPAEFAWSDVGSWQSVYELRSEKRDDAGNIVEGEAVVVDCSGCLIQAESGRVVAAMGLTDLVVIDTPDALLVAPLESSQEVRRVVAELKGRGMGRVV